MGDRYSKGIVDFIIVPLISSPPSSSSSILRGQSAKSLGWPSLIRYKRAKDD